MASDKKKKEAVPATATADVVSTVERGPGVLDVIEVTTGVHAGSRFAVGNSEMLPGESDEVVGLKLTVQKLLEDKEELTNQVEQLKATLLKTVTGSPVSGMREFAIVDGVEYAIVSKHRADNTFSDVKRGFCSEGVMLLAINRPG